MCRAAVLFLVTVLVYGCGKQEAGSGRAARPGDAKQSPAAFPPADWGHKELAEHLGQKGVKVEVRHGNSIDRPDRPAALFYTNSGKKNQVGKDWYTEDTSEVIVYRCENGEAAKATAATASGGSFSAGRFAICCNEVPKNKTLADRIQSALR